MTHEVARPSSSTRSALTLALAMLAFGAACAPDNSSDGAEAREESSALRRSVAVGSVLKVVEARALRSAPSADASRIRVLAIGELTHALDSSPTNGFYHVRTVSDSLEGWVYGSRLDTSPRADCPHTMPASIDGALVLHEDFDGAAFVNVQEFSYKGGTARPTTSIWRRGSGAAVFRVGDPQLTPAQCTDGRYRAEAVAKPVQTFDWNDGITHWIGVSANPTNFKGGAYTLIQVHAPNEPPGATCDYAGNAFTLAPVLRDGTMYYELDVILAGGRSAGEGAGSNQTLNVWSERMIENRWVDFVMGFTLSTKGKGFFYFFRNGQLVYSKTGVTNVNSIDSCGVPIPAHKRSHNGPHIGIYGPPCGSAAWMQALAGPDHRREIVMDELRVATGPQGYLYADPVQCGVLPAGYPTL